jgi:hypothetical protein
LWSFGFWGQCPDRTSLPYAPSRLRAPRNAGGRGRRGQATGALPVRLQIGSRKCGRCFRLFHQDLGWSLQCVIRRARNCHPSPRQRDSLGAGSCPCLSWVPACSAEALCCWCRRNHHYFTDLHGGAKRVLTAIMALATAVLTTRNPVTISMGQNAENVRTTFENTARFPDFQAEYTPAVISNGYHQRVSVSVVASLIAKPWPLSS